MKITNWFLNNIAIGGSMIVSVFSGITGIILLLSVIFNFPPYISGKDGSIGFLDFENGIPYNAPAGGSIPDSIEIIETSHGSSTIYSRPNDKYDREKFIPKGDIQSHIKIVTNYENHAEKEDKIKINSSQINTIRFYIKAKTFGIKILFALPIILTLFTISFCSWKTGMLLHAIQNGFFFEHDNYKRILQIGFAILILQAILITLSIFQLQYIGYVNIQFNSSIPDYKQPFVLSADANIQINWGWIVAGCIFIILSKAFYKGHNLQKEQEGTI